MSVQEQLINDIKLLPEHTLQALSIIVKEFILLNSKQEGVPRPVYGSGKGQMWIADDFEAKPMRKMHFPKDLRKED